MFYCQGLNIYLIFSTFISRPTSLLACNRFSVIPFTQHQHRTKTDMLQSKSLLSFYDLNNGVRPVTAQLVQWLGYGLNDQGSRVDSQWGLGIFLFTTMSRTAVRPTQPPIPRVPGALSLEVKQPGCEVNHSPPSSAEVKNVWGYTSIPPIHLHGMVLSLAQGQLYLFWC